MKWEELTTDKLEDQRINKISIFFIVSKDQEELGAEGVDGILNVDMGDIIRIKGQEPLAEVILAGVRVELVDEGELLVLRPGLVPVLVGKHQEVLVVNLKLSLTAGIPRGQSPLNNSLVTA